MNVRPILFSGPMVRALLDGRKTQTRRVLKPQPSEDAVFVNIYGLGLTAAWFSVASDCDQTAPVPFAPGDLLWVREAWSHTGQGVWTVADAQLAIGGSVIYRAEDDQPGVGWFPSIHMPRRFSRLTLTVTDVRVQRVQEISEDDAKAEGARPAFSFPGWEGVSARPSYRWGFHELWDSLNAKRGFGWDINPWVAAITYTVEQANVDDVIARAG